MPTHGEGYQDATEFKAMVGTTMKAIEGGLGDERMVFVAEDGRPARRVERLLQRERLLPRGGCLVSYETIPSDGVPIKAWTRGVPVEDVARKQLTESARPIAARRLNDGDYTTRNAREGKRVAGDGRSQGPMSTTGRPKFHLSNGVWFSRKEDGSVVIEVLSPDGEGRVLHALTATPQTWASAVAFVSQEGENAVTYREALHFHGGHGTCPAWDPATSDRQHERRMNAEEGAAIARTRSERWYPKSPEQGSPAAVSAALRSMQPHPGVERVVLRKAADMLDKMDGELEALRSKRDSAEA